MRPFTITVSVILFCVLCAVFSAAPPVFAECDTLMATVVSAEGDVEIRRVDGAPWTAAKLDDVICIGGMIRVGENSRAALRLANDANLRLDQFTAITFTGVEREKSLLMDLVDGAVHFFSRFPKSLKVTTPFVNGTVEGTEFAMRVGENGATVSVFKGKVRAENAAGSLLLAKGQTGVAEKGAAPALHPVARPRDAVAWGLYYPAVDRWDNVSEIAGPGSPFADAAARSFSAYGKNDIPAAIGALSAVPEDGGSAALQAYRASLYLTVGRVEKAGFHIQRSLMLSPENGPALALKSVLLLVGNEKDEALSVAERAVSAHPESAGVRMAHAYALQAHFRLEEALSTLEQAAGSHPDNAPVFARIAELKLSTGDINGALAAADKAIAINPNLSTAHAVLGFAHLMRIDREAAEAAFEKAIALDSASPLPRLGLGLAIIRGGDLEGGRKQIEIASGLDSSNSLVRSYLGKAYFDETRDGDAEDQYEIAKNLDPNDPTPWFYGALAKHAANRPVEALADLQKSIELNDNRAVFRSRFQLDEDLAARSAGLARIYRDLGFGQLALAEGWKAVAKDPGSYAAHRFLADSYSALPKHEIARVSELLQAQLRQPLSVTPVQPSLAETDLTIYQNAGVSDPAFNEYTPLFLRNRAAFQGGAVMGGDGTLGEEVIFSGVADRVSYSIGQFHYETVGFRENNFLERDIVNAFVQAQLSPKASVQAEFRSVEKENGDLGLLFDPENYNPNVFQDEKTVSARLGGRYVLSPGSDLLFSAIFSDSELSNQLEQELNISLPMPVGPLNVDQEFGLQSEQASYQSEIQYEGRYDNIQLTTGGSYFHQKKDESTEISFRPQIPPFLTDIDALENSTTEHINFYIYAQTVRISNVILTLGSSLDRYKDLSREMDIDQFNPKFGFEWNPKPSTTIRIAAFKTLKRTLASNQTLEPTQIAGFNQFYDDANGSSAWSYGIGIDKKWVEKGIYGGLEYSRRELSVPYISDVTDEVDEGDWKDGFFRAYFYWTPDRYVALSAELQLESTDRDDNLSRLEYVSDLDTYKFPLSVKVFHPCGGSLALTATYVTQEGVFGSSPDKYVEDSDRFWITDITASYRLPKQNGMISVGVKNLFNQSFRFQDTDPRNPSFYPSRLILVRCTLAF